MIVDDTINKYKVRFVIKGFSQQEGVYYFDTYSSVSKITSIQMLIDIITINNLKIHQINVKAIFLNCDLDEKVYKEQPKGFIINGQEKKSI